MQKIHDTLKRLLYIFMSILFLYLLYSVFENYIKNVCSSGEPLLIGILTLIAFLSLVFIFFTSKFMSTLKKYQILLALFFVSLVMRVALLLLIDVEQADDFGRYLAIARGGDPKLVFHFWPIHTPFILVEKLIIKIFGEGQFPLLVFFNIMMSFCPVFIFLIAEKFLKIRYALYASLLVMINPSLLLFCFVLTNQNLATPLFLAGIWLLACRPVHRRWYINDILAGFMLVSSNLMRPELIPALITLAIYAILMMLNIKETNMRISLKPIISTLIMIVMFYGISAVVDAVVQSRYRLSGSITSFDLNYKFAVGLNSGSKAKNTKIEADIYYSDNSQVVKSAMFKSLIKERLSDPDKVAKLFIEKIGYQWTNMSGYTLFFRLNYLAKFNDDSAQQQFGRFYYNSNVYLHANWLAIIFLGLTYMISRIKECADIHSSEILPTLLLAAYVGVFMLFEVQSRYNMFMIPFFSFFAAGGLKFMVKCFDEKRYKKNID